MKHRSEIGQFCFCCKMFDRKTWNYVEPLQILFLWSRMYIMYFTRCSLVCHVSIADWFVPFIGREYVDTWHIDTSHILIGRSTFTELWSDGHQYAKFEKKLRTGREFVDTWRVKYIRNIHSWPQNQNLQKSSFCDRTFYNKSKTGRFQTDVSCWTCGNPKCLPEITSHLKYESFLIIYKIGVRG